MAVVVSMVMLQVMAAEPWCACSADVQTKCLESGLHKDEQVVMGKWCGGGEATFILFADGPMMGHCGESVVFPKLSASNWRLLCV